MLPTLGVGVRRRVYGCLPEENLRPAASYLPLKAGG
jgi:hypothetical protein